jgi:hypothetical protein
MGKIKTLNSFLFICVLLSSAVSNAQNNLIKVAVIDTGIHSSLLNESFLCKDGHKDFTNSKNGIADNHGHGTNVSGLIDQHVKGMLLSKHSLKSVLKTKANYCQVILKFYDPVGNNSLDATVKAFEHAISLKVDYINYSAGGSDYSKAEHEVIKKALNAGIKIIVAAGNEGSDLQKKPYYPAKLDSRLIVVGNYDSSKQRAPTSNYGKDVDVWENGVNSLSYHTSSAVSSLTGTSQATSVHTGKQRYSR